MMYAHVMFPTMPPSHRLLLFATYLLSVASNISAQEIILMNCLDPECSTPFLIGKIVTDIPEFALSKNTVVEVYAQTVEEDASRVKVGDRYYDVHNSFLSFTTISHKPQSLVQVKLPRLHLPTVQPIRCGKKCVSLSTSPNSGDSSSAEKATLSVGDGNIPSSHQQRAQVGHLFSQNDDNQVTLPKKTSSFQPPRSPTKNVSPSQPVDGFQKVPSSTSQTAEGAKMHLRKEVSNFSSPPQPESASLRSTIKTENISGSAKQYQQQNPQPASNTIKGSIRQTLDSKLPKSTVEKSQVPLVQKPVEVVHSNSSQINEETSIVPEFATPPGESPTTVDYFQSEKPPAQDADVLSTDPSHLIIEPTLERNTQTLSNPLSMNVTNKELKPSKPKCVNSTNREEKLVPTDRMEAEDSAVENIQLQSKTIPEMVTSESTIEATLLSGSEQKHVKFDDQMASNAPLESYSPHTGTSKTERGDSQNGSLLDIATESAFFHCLLYASDGTFISPSTNSPLSTGRKSLLANAVLFCARHYFKAAQTLLLKMSPPFVASVDRLLNSTFHLPAAFFVAWALFVLSISIAWLFIKLFNRLLFAGFASSGLDDSTRRSLAEWLALEENANLFAGSLADKEEAYARLIIWSTKVSERYENQTRDHSNSEMRINSQLRETKIALAKSLQETTELKDTHDALVEQLSCVREEAAVTAKQLKMEVSTLNTRLGECARQYEDNMKEINRANEDEVKFLRKENLILVQEVKNYQLRLEESAKTANEMKTRIAVLEENLAAWNREFSCLGETISALKNAERQNKEKLLAEAAAKKQKEDELSTDGWEAEEEVKFDETVESDQQHMNDIDKVELESILQNFLEVGRLKRSLEESTKEARSAAAALKEETEQRVKLQEAIDKIKAENLDLVQKLRIATEDCDVSKNKLEILSEYFKEREATLQRDLGRQALTESESLEELNALRNKQRSSEVEIKTLRHQLTSTRLELSESERVNRHQIGELDKRLYDNWLSTRALENLVSDLRSENSTLRQKMLISQGSIAHKVLSSMPLPPPPPPPPVALMSTKLPEVLSSLCQPEKGVGSHAQMHRPPPPLFPPVLLANPNESKFVLPPPLSHGISPANSSGSQTQKPQSIRPS